MKKLSFKMPKLKKPGKRTVIIGIIFAIIASVLIYINSDPILRTAIIKFFNPDYTPIQYEVSIKDTDNTLFTRVGDDILLATSEGVINYDKKLSASPISPMAGKSPQIHSDGDYYIQYFKDSPTAYVVCDGEGQKFQAKGKILTACINSDGYFAIVCEEKGYKALVTVYNDDFEEVFKWHSAENFITAASVSPDNKSMALATHSFGYEEQKAGIYVFDFSKEEPVSFCSTTNNMIASIHHIDDDEILCVGSDALSLYSKNGNRLWDVPYEGDRLLNYTVSEDFVAVANLSSTAILGNSHISIYDFDGKLLGKFENSEEIINLDSYEDVLLVANKKSVLVTDETGKVTNNIRFSKNIKQGLLFGDTGYAAIITGNVIHSVLID